MADGSQYQSSVVKNMSKQSYIVSSLSPYIFPRGCNSSTGTNINEAEQPSSQFAFHGRDQEVETNGSPSTPSTVHTPREKWPFSSLVNYLMGGIPYTICNTAAAPIERVKLLLQNQNEMIKSGRLNKPYKGITDCFARTIKDEGVLSLWRGNTCKVIKYFPSQALYFAFLGYFNSHIYSENKTNGYWKSFFLNLASVAAAGACTSLFVYSLDYAQTRLANDIKVAKMGGQRQFNGLIDVYEKTIHSDGVGGLYRGFGISCVQAVVFHGLYYGMFDSLKRVVLVDDLQHSTIASFLLGWAISIVAVMASYPMDTVARRMMMTSGEVEIYKSSMEAFTRIIKNEGAKSLFKGFGANILCAVAGSCVLAVFDNLQHYLYKKK